MARFSYPAKIRRSYIAAANQATERVISVGFFITGYQDNTSGHIH